jgi:hypothetical protein
LAYPTYPFVDYDNVDGTFSNDPQVILVTSTNNIIAFTIGVVNIGNEDIRVNFQLATTSTGESPTTRLTYIAKDLLIPPPRKLQGYKENNNINILHRIGKDHQFLKYNKGNVLTQGIVCFSNGSNQIFDCIIDYVVLNEIPPTPS